MICSKYDEKSIGLCAASLKAGKIVIIPTDTVYGFSGIVDDKYNTADEIRKIKGRAESKPFIQLIAKPEDVLNYCEEPIPQSLLKFWPGPLTIIIKNKFLKDCEVKTTAFRCPGDIWLRKIIEKLDTPVYSTSVNRSGFPVLDSEKEIKAEFEKDVDLIVLDGDKKNALPSTIVSYLDGKVTVLRQGSLKVE